MKSINLRKGVSLFQLEGSVCLHDTTYTGSTVFILQAEAKSAMKSAKAKYRFLGQDLERVSWGGTQQSDKKKKNGLSPSKLELL